MIEETLTDYSCHAYSSYYFQVNKLTQVHIIGRHYICAKYREDGENENNRFKNVKKQIA